MTESPRRAVPPGRTDKLGLQPLTARSVILSVLLGTHPPELPVRSLVRTTQLFGISEGTTRVALSRLVAERDVIAENSGYRLNDRLVTRQQRQDEGRVPATRPWRGGWEMAVARAGTRGAAARDNLHVELSALRLGELRAGVWTRPANLRRDWPGSLRERVWRFEARPSTTRRQHEPAPARELAARLWDLTGWARRAEALLDALTSDDPADRFMVAAAIVRHLRADPLLPTSLLPPRWPGSRLRAAYAAYEQELGRLLQRERRRHG